LKTALPQTILAAKCRAIHAACREMGMDEATRRDLIEAQAGPGKRSTKDLEVGTANKVLDRLLALGASLGGHKDSPIRVAPEKVGLLSKIGALLADQKKPWSYAHAIARNNFKKDRVEWLPVEQMRGLIAQLSKQAKG
jgi:phage gp16-like protein